MSKPRKKELATLYELVDEKLDKLELKLAKLERHVKNVNQVLSDDILLALNLALLFHLRKMDTSHLDNVVELAKKRATENEKIERPVIGINIKNSVKLVVRLAKTNEIPFEKLAPYLISKLGKKLAEKLVSKEEMLQNYGQEGLAIWNTLLK